MPLANLHTLAAAGLLAATKKTSSGGSDVFFIFLILIVGLYFLFIAPQRRKMRAQMNQQTQVEEGDEVVTSAGLYGTVVGSDGDRIRLEIAPGTVIEVARSAIGRRVPPLVAEPEEDEEEPEEHEDAHGWEPPSEDEEPADGIAADGTGTVSDGAVHEPAASGDWAHPWEGGSKGEAPPSGGSS